MLAPPAAPILLASLPTSYILTVLRAGLEADTRKRDITLSNKKPAEPTAETKFIADAAQLAVSGRPDLAARFVDLLRRADLGGTLTEYKTPRSYTTRPLNAVNVIPQIERDNLRVSLYGSAAEHAELHGPDCQLAFTKARSGRTAETTATADQLADLQAHVERAVTLKAARTRVVRLAS